MKLSNDVSPKVDVVVSTNCRRITKGRQPDPMKSTESVAARLDQGSKHDELKPSHIDRVIAVTNTTNANKMYLVSCAEYLAISSLTSFDA